MIFINPEYGAYIYQVNHLKDLLTDKIVERDFLIHYYCKDLKVEYMLKIGALEYKKLITEDKLEKVKRKIELIEEMEYFDESEIDEIIKKEFIEHSEIEKEMFEDINAAIDFSMQDPISTEEMQELNELYAVIVRSWNPALNVSLSAQKRDLYDSAEKAYIKGNKKLLNNYIKLIDDEEILEMGELNELKTAKERYTILLKENEELLKIIKNSFPYSEKDIIEDENLLRRRKDTINAETDELREDLKFYEKELEKLLKDNK